LGHAPPFPQNYTPAFLFCEAPLPPTFLLQEVFPKSSALIFPVALQLQEPSWQDLTIKEHMLCYRCVVLGFWASILFHFLNILERRVLIYVFGISETSKHRAWLVRPTSRRYPVDHKPVSNHTKKSKNLERRQRGLKSTSTTNSFK
jgi:hypothetical protein